MPPKDIEQLSIDTIRTLSMDAVQQANAGHPGTAMALAPLAYLLYKEVLRVNPAQPHWPDRDRFVLSAGHACILQYSTLHLAGYNLSLEELKRFRQWESATPGHPEFRHTEGIEVTTGPLGQGFANGVGMAIAERFLAGTFNRPHHTIVDHRIYAICSDGDLMEGISYEAGSIAGQLGLGQLIYFYDDNRITIDGTTSLSFSREDKHARFEAQGWHVQNVADVNDLDALRAAIAEAQEVTDQPSMIIVRSHIGYPSPKKTDTAGAHGSPLGEDEVRATKEVMGWDPDEHFVVPTEVAEHMNGVARGQELEDDWRQRFEAWSQAFPTERERWDAAWAGRVGPWTPPEFDAGEEIATRDAGKKVMQAFKDAVPTMIGGAADLVESTKTEFTGSGVFSADWTGRNIAFGIREHAMGAIVNGIGVHGGCVKPYGSTFLIFSDYMRPSVRLSALMKLPVVWAWTHDSVGLGEDGPTHQPVETYAALRAIPNLWFMRPGDANETAYAWKAALERQDGPVALSFSREKVPTLDRSGLATADGVERGAYVLWDSAESPDLILIGTGAQLGLALDAGRKIAEDGTAVRVVSMPCWELFEEQPQAYRDEVLPPDVKARLSVESGVSLGWSKWVGDAGDSISIEHFGASAPGTTVLEKFGYTVHNVVARATALLAKVA
ncbi:MAG: transketolase [Gaiellaceae bacterium]|jgi:transketolase|nr:transketolase [Gaiellaceae bacterium]